MRLAPPLSWVHRLHGWLHRHWESQPVQRAVATALLAIFSGALALIELRRLGMLPFGADLAIVFLSLRDTFTDQHVFRASGFAVRS